MRAGGLPVMLPLTAVDDDVAEFMESCSGFLLTGGHDVDPSVYGQSPLSQLGPLCRARDEMETKVVREAIRRDKPVLGICRGIQILNACLGGTLYQDLNAQRHAGAEHHMDKPYDGMWHRVVLVEGTPLHDLLHVKEMEVNSIHHQAVRTLATSLQPMAVSEDGLIEAAYRPDQRFFWGVQWHPEYLYRNDENSRRIFEAFVDAAR